jgi:hypothetical protein
MNLYYLWPQGIPKKACQPPRLEKALAWIIQRLSSCAQPIFAEDLYLNANNSSLETLKASNGWRAPILVATN